MQNTYSQNSEDLFVLNYFGLFKGRLLEIGANDGITLSNSRLLIENGWSANLCEPGLISNKLFALYNDNENVTVHRFGIGTKKETVKFWESGAHVPNGNDYGLVSTTNFEETKRWPNVAFAEREIDLVPFSEVAQYGPFEYISIDAEGMDWDILKQIDLEAIGCKVLCIEWNRNNELGEKFANYCKGYKVGLMNAENLIFVK